LGQAFRHALARQIGMRARHFRTVAVTVANRFDEFAVLAHDLADMAAISLLARETLFGHGEPREAQVGRELLDIEALQQRNAAGGGDRRMNCPYRLIC
jgi:hypothetical protein